MKLKLLLPIILFFSCSDGAETLYKEFKPSAVLKKYEYFKDLSAAVDKKRADIELYREEIKNYKVEDKDDKFYLEQRKSELMGIISVHNSLCSDYNAAMAKINYMFCNAGKMPESNMEPLPREFKPYVLSLK